MRNLLNRRTSNISKDGFTVLELIVVIAIIGTLSFLSAPLFQSWGSKRALDESINEFYSVFSSARLDAFARGVTIRVGSSKTNDDYTLTTYYLDGPTESCDVGLSWTQSSQRIVDLNSNFVVTGSALGNVCFYRDGTSTGGNFSFDQKNGGTDLGSADVTITLATGFIDVIK